MQCFILTIPVRFSIFMFTSCYAAIFCNLENTSGQTVHYAFSISAGIAVCAEYQGITSLAQSGPIIINHFIHSHMHKSSYDNGIEDIKLYIQFLL